MDWWIAFLETSHFQAGCPVLAVAAESHPDAPQLAAAAAEVFDRWQTTISRALRRGGIAEQPARELATLAVAAVEGAMVMCRATHDRQPLVRVGAQLKRAIEAALPRKSAPRCPWPGGTAPTLGAVSVPRRDAHGADDVHEVLGRIGLPAPIEELARRRWDAVVVGGGHNGLTAAAYLARAGQSVLVIEARPRLGGACTLDRPFPDHGYVISPCAYLVGLLHPLVIKELGLARRGYRVHAVDPVSWCPFEDGASFTEWKDDRRTAVEIERLSPCDVAGYFAYQDVYRRIRERLRHPDHDTWVGDAPDRAQIEDLLGHDSEAIDVVFHTSIADLVERYISDDRLRTALHGAGVIGTWAGPRDPGTAAVRLMHNLGVIGGWGYVEGGMGHISFAIAQAAGEAGAVLASGVRVSAVVPGVGVILEGGELVRAQAVVSNADPKATLALCPEDVSPSFRSRMEAWSITSPVVKLNCGLSRLPRFSAARDAGTNVHRAMVTISNGIDATQDGFEACKKGEAAPAWCELYFQTAYDPTVAPAGKHTMGVFAQYAPYDLATGDWNTRRASIGEEVLALIARFAPDVVQCVEHLEVLGPPDIEACTGLTGGHIFQGSCLPEQMWDRRLPPRTAVPGLYLCGAATHPGGSVIGVNGRNAAMAVLADLRR